jgi:hypothetical protein
MMPFIATYVPSTGIWSPVVSNYNASDGEVSAQVSHFSIWGVFSFVGSAVKKLAKDVFDSLFGSIKVTDPAPTCGDSVGLTSLMTPANGDLEVCTQNGTGDTAILKVKSYLAFPVDIDYFSGEQVSVTPPGDLFTEIGGVLNNLSDLGYKGTVIAAGSEADVSFPLQVNQAGRVYSDLDTVAYLTGIIESGVNVLSLMESRLGKNPRAVLDAMAQGKCADEVGQLSSVITKQINLSALDQISQTAIDCASTVVDLGVGGTIDAIIGTVDGLIENVLQSAFGAAILIVGGPNGTNTAITVRRSAVAPPVWSGPSDLAPNGETLTGVSCTSPTFCMAVGYVPGTGPSAGDAFADTAYTWNGVTWAPAASLDSLTAGVSSPWLQGVSCASSTDCLAYGSGSGPPTSSGIGPILTSVYAWNGSTWSITGFPLEEDGVAALDCVTVNFCVALADPDQDVANGGAVTGALWNGSSWGMTDIPGLTVPGTTPLALSCPTTRFCMMVTNENGPIMDSALQPTQDDVSYDWNGSQWSKVTWPDQTVSVNIVSCSSPNSCLATASPPGSPTGATQTSGDDWFRWNGSDWTEQSGSLPGELAASSLSCPTSSMCMAVGSPADITTAPSPPGFADLWNGQSWVGANLTSTAAESFTGVSCLSSVFCGVVGPAAQIWSSPSD